MRYKELSNYSLNDILQMLESNDDLSDILLILQLSELNLLKEIESKNTIENVDKKASLPLVLDDDEEDEDELLSSSLKDNDINRKEPDMNLNKQKYQKELLEKIQKIIESIKNRPQEFLGKEPHKEINKKMGFSLIPSAKDARSALASKILIELAKGKEKDLKVYEGSHRSEAIQNIKRSIREKNAGIG